MGTDFNVHCTLGYSIRTINDVVPLKFKRKITKVMVFGGNLRNTIGSDTVDETFNSCANTIKILM